MVANDKILAPPRRLFRTQPPTIYQRLSSAAGWQNSDSALVLARLSRINNRAGLRAGATVVSVRRWRGDLYGNREALHCKLNWRADLDAARWGCVSVECWQGRRWKSGERGWKKKIEKVFCVWERLGVSVYLREREGECMAPLLCVRVHELESVHAWHRWKDFSGITV